MGSGNAMGVQELSTIIWRQRQLLELLVFKLTEEQLLLTSGRTAWLSHATREVEEVVTRLYDVELLRDVQAAQVAADWDAADATTLRDLIPHAPPPWDEVLRGHLEALTALTTQIRTVRDANGTFLREGLRATQETLAGLDASGGTYDARGASTATRAPAAQLVDREL